MSKYTKKRIKEIETLTLETIPAAINKGITDSNEYLIKCRIPLNLTIIQAIFGCEFISGKKAGNYKVKFNHKLPNHDELLSIVKLVNNFNMAEKNFITTVYDDEPLNYNDSDNMDIPPYNTELVSSNNIPKLEKINSKKINDYIFGNNSISKLMLTGMDVFELSVVAEKIKKVKIRNRMIIIGGVAILLTGGAIATAGIIRHNNKNKNNDILDPDIDINEVNIDDITEDNIIDEETPTVEFDEAV